MTKIKSLTAHLKVRPFERLAETYFFSRLLETKNSVLSVSPW